MSLKKSQNLYNFWYFTVFWIYDFIRTWFAKVTTLSQKLIFARIVENNRGGIFLKFLLDAGCDN